MWGERDEAGVRPGTAPCARGGQLAQPTEIDDEHAAVLAFLADGESWSSSRWRSRSGPASARCSVRSTRSPRQVKCSGTVAGGRALDDAPRRRIHDDLATPGSAAGRLGSTGCASGRWHAADTRSPLKSGVWPFLGVDHVHGVTYDGRSVLVCGRRLAEGVRSRQRADAAVDRCCRACGTAFDGQHLYQLADDRIQKIDPDTGEYSPRSRRLAAVPASRGPKEHLARAVSRPEDPSDRSAHRSGSSNDRVQPVRDRRHPGRQRAARHLGR